MPGVAGALSRSSGRAHRLGAAHPRGFFHQGAPALGEAALRTGRDLQALHAVAAAHLSPAGQLQVATALDALATLEAHLDEAASPAAGRRPAPDWREGARRAAAWGRPGHCPGHYLLAGRGGRFSSSRKAVRFAGLDITVHPSDSKRSPGRPSRQGPPVLRWAVYEAGKTHARALAPDHRYYAQVKDRKDSKRAAISEARKILRQACHILTELGDDALTAT